MAEKKTKQGSTAARLTEAATTAGRALGRTAGLVAARAMPAASDDAIALLEADHRRLEELLEEGEKTTERGGKRRMALLKRLKAALEAHERMEEKVLYPVLKGHREARDIVLEGYQEHHVADLIVAELQRLDPADERWGAKFKVLKENIEHHIEEEEGEMFRTARRVLGRDQRVSIGRKMQAVKNSPTRSSRRPAA